MCSIASPRRIGLVVALGLALATPLAHLSRFTAAAAPANPDTGAAVEDAEVLARQVVVKDVVVRGDLVVGTLVNRTRKSVTRVKLLIERSWIWADEQHPGEDSPGSSFYREIAVDLPPGGETPFTVRLEEATEPSANGHFQTRVHVVGLTEVG